MRPVKLSIVLEWMESEGLLDTSGIMQIVKNVPDAFEIAGFASVDLAGDGAARFWAGDTAKSGPKAAGFAR